MDLCETFQKQFASGLVPRHEKLQDEKKFERFTSSRMGAFRMAGLSSAEPSLPRSQARWKPGRAVAQPALCFPCDCIITPGCVRRVPWGGQRRPGVSKAGRKCEWRAGGMEKGDPGPLGRLPGRCLWLPGESEQRAAGSRKDSRSGGAGPGVEGPGQDASFSQAV